MNQKIIFKKYVSLFLLVTVCAFGAACTIAESEVTPEPVDEPKWTTDDAKAAVREFLLDSVNRDAFLNRALIVLEMPELFALWTAEYAGEGWWRVSGEKLGWDKQKDGWTSGVWRVSENSGFLIPHDREAIEWHRCLINYGTCKR